MKKKKNDRIIKLPHIVKYKSAHLNFILPI